MKAKDAVIALDTSNYTTSLAALTLDGELIFNLKRPLRVKEGAVGLRQSDAVFSHTVNIPSVMREGASLLSEYNIRAIGVSERPRNVEGSYMPCFLAGIAAAESLSSMLSLPLYRFSHQCGHIMAAIYSSGKYELIGRTFGAFHISGGTTELVRVTPSEGEFKTELIGGTADLNAGQVIDRIGVMLGLSFPAGRQLEELALSNTEKIPKKKVSYKDLYVNLSGLENMASTLYKSTENKSLTAAFVFDYLSEAISKMIDGYYGIYGRSPMILAGGVMCNSIIKKRLSEKYEVYFAEPALSADNAVGVCALALKAYKSEYNL